MFADGTMAGTKCAFTAWSGLRGVVVTASGPAQIRFGSFAPAVGGGARLTRSISLRANGDTPTPIPGPPPFRIELTAAPGTRVSFVAA